MSRHIEKIGSPSSSQDDEMVPDTKGSKKTQDMLVGFPIFACRINTQLIEGILKDNEKDKTHKFNFNNVLMQNHDGTYNLDVTNTSAPD